MVGIALCVSEGGGTMLSVVGSTPVGPKVMALSVDVGGGPKESGVESGVCVVSGGVVETIPEGPKVTADADESD